MNRINKLLIALALLGLTLCVAQAETLHVTVLLAEEGAAYREFAQTFEAEATRQNLPLVISQTNLLPSEADLIVAVGSKSAEIATASPYPVLCVLISKSRFERLAQERNASRDKNNFSAIYLDQPSKRQIDLIAAVLPEAKNIGLLFSTPYVDILDLRKAVEEKGLTLHEQQLGSVESLHRDLQSLLQESDVLLAIPDAQIYNSSTIRNILLDTYRNGDPVIGFSPSYVRAGALGAVFSTPQQFATQAAYLTKLFVETGLLPAAQYPNEFEIMVNQQVAYSLGIQIKEAAILLKQVKAATGRSK